MPHGKKRSLYDHLLGCFDLAALLEFDQTTCLVAGLHSVYGTSIFQPRLLTNREVIRSEFSTTVEELVFLFHCLDRSYAGWPWSEEYKNRFIDAPMALSPEQAKILKRVEIVNIFEQEHPRTIAATVASYI